MSSAGNPSRQTGYPAETSRDSLKLALATLHPLSQKAYEWSRWNETMPDRTIGFRSRQAAQIAGFFARRNGFRIEKLKLIKLLYLTERESIETRGRPMMYDEYYSLKDGPICTNSLDGLNGRIDKEIWSRYLDKDRGNVLKASRLVEGELDELSESDRAIVEAIWQKFGWMTSSQIRNWTHRHCREYIDVKGGRMPISYRSIGAALGFPDADEIEARVREYRSAEAAIMAE
jgi:uncharacterized phage-associated protein